MAMLIVRYQADRVRWARLAGNAPLRASDVVLGAAPPARRAEG